MRSGPLLSCPAGSPEPRWAALRGSGREGGRPQVADRGFLRPPGAAGAHAPRKLDRPVADPQQPADLEPDGFPEPAHLAVSPLVQNHPKAAVSPLRRALGGEAIEPRRAILEN